MKQQRKKTPKGERTQKMFSFRLDDDLVDFLNSQPNKGRFINDLIRDSARRKKLLFHD